MTPNPIYILKYRFWLYLKFYSYKRIPNSLWKYCCFLNDIWSTSSQTHSLKAVDDAINLHFLETLVSRCHTIESSSPSHYSLFLFISLTLFSSTTFSQISFSRQFPLFLCWQAWQTQHIINHYSPLPLLWSWSMTMINHSTFSQ